jgi:hypothetical protein
MRSKQNIVKVFQYNNIWQKYKKMKVVQIKKYKILNKKINKKIKKNLKYDFVNNP